MNITEWSARQFTSIELGMLRRISINSLWPFSARVSAQALTLVFTALVARRFGETGLGQFAFIAAIIFLGNMFTTFGMDTLLIREIARTHNPATALISAALEIQLALSGVFIAFVVGSAMLFAREPIALVVYSLTLIPLAFYTIYSALLRAFERMDLLWWLNLTTAFLQMLAAVSVFATRADLTVLITLLLASQVMTALLAAIICARSLPTFTFRWRIKQTDLRSILHAAVPFALLATLAVIYQRLGIFTLASTGDDGAMGWYSAAARIVEALKLAPQALLGALFPLAAHATFRAPKIFRMAIIASITFAAITAIAGTWFARPLIAFIYGDRFAPSAVALQILVWSLIPYAISANISLELVTQGHEWRALYATAVVIACGAIIFFMLVPTLSWLGASWATLASECLQAIVFIIVKFALRSSPIIRKAT